MDSSSIPVRFGHVLRVRPEFLGAYRDAHAAIWPGVLAQMRLSNLRNYSIFHHDDLLFAYYEYCGNNYDDDMARMATDPATQEWRKLIRPMQQPLPSRKAGEWWARMEPVFRFDGSKGPDGGGG